MRHRHRQKTIRDSPICCFFQYKLIILPFSTNLTNNRIKKKKKKNIVDVRVSITLLMYFILQCDITLQKVRKIKSDHATYTWNEIAILILDTRYLFIEKKTVDVCYNYIYYVLIFIINLYFIIIILYNIYYL